MTCQSGSRNRPDHREATLKHLVANLLQWRLARYGVASFAGTVVDLGGLALLVALDMAAGAAAGLSYALGTIVHWLVSSRFVFPDRLADAGFKRGGQQLLFVGSALLGIAITSLVISWGVAAGLHLAAAKGAAMLSSFLAVFMIRLTIVFRARR